MFVPINIVLMIVYLGVLIYLETLDPGAVSFDDLESVKGYLVEVERGGRRGACNKYVVASRDGDKVEMWGTSGSPNISMDELKTMIGDTAEAYYAVNSSSARLFYWNMNSIRHLEMGGEVIIDHAIINRNIRNAEKSFFLSWIFPYGMFLVVIVVLVFVLYKYCTAKK